MEEKEISVRKWVQKYKAGEFNKKDVITQIKAGWYDWFCSDKALAGKTKQLAGIATKLKDGGKIDLDKHYVWFKNNCPLHGPLYDDVRFADLKTGYNAYVIKLQSDGVDGVKYHVYHVPTDAGNPVATFNTRKELHQYLNNETQKEED